MEKFNYVIVGGGAAGTSAAETIRRNDSFSSILIISDEPYTLYSRPLLSKPNFFLGKIPLGQIWLKDQNWYDQNKISFMGGKKAVNFDSKNKIITLNDGVKIQYEKLLLATGVCARRWNAPGADKKGVYYLRNFNEEKMIMEAVKSAKNAVIIGGGFIGFEMAEILKMSGLNVTVIILENYFWEPILDATSGLLIEKTMIQNGVKIMKKSEVQKVLGEAKIEGIALKDGTNVPCDMIICGIGTTCPMDWLKVAGLQTNRGILTNEYMETNLPDIWAAGDVAEYKDLILEESVQMGNWVNAQEQGKIAGLNMAGKKQPFKFVSFYTTQGFGITIAFIGDVRSEPNRVIINRDSPETNSYGRIIIVGKELVGATLINRTRELTAITKLISGNIDVSEKQKELADANFDLKSLF